MGGATAMAMAMAMASAMRDCRLMPALVAPSSLALRCSGNGFFVGCVAVSRFRMFQFHGRSVEKRDGGGLPLSVRADTAALVESAEAKKSSDEGHLISKLLSIVKGSNRGAGFGEEEQNEVGDVVQKLERYCIPKPVEGRLLFGRL